MNFFRALVLWPLLLIGSAQALPTNVFVWQPGLKVFLIGGGPFHDYDRWFKGEDAETLHKSGILSTQYTDDTETASRELQNADVMVLSCNKPGFDTETFRYAVSNFVNAGKGIVLLHSGTWYNWDWTKTNSGEYNRELVGGGAREHRGEGPFTETVIKDHPVTAGLPKTYQAIDELYFVEPAPGGSPMEILEEASIGGVKYPSVWITHYRTNRIVCIALGHGGAAHTSPEFKTLLVNAVKWAGGK